jgi:hypothetical protein
VLNMTLGLVLGFAVWLDHIYRKNAK